MGNDANSGTQSGPRNTYLPGLSLERTTGFEPATLTLAKKKSIQAMLRSGGRCKLPSNTVYLKPLGPHRASKSGAVVARLWHDALRGGPLARPRRTRERRACLAP